MAKAVIHSGSYMLYEKHIARPDINVFNDIKLQTPNYSGRMDNLRASILRVQLKELDINCKRWNDRYHVLLADNLQKAKGNNSSRKDPNTSILSLAHFSFLWT